MTVLEAGSQTLPVTYPDETVSEAAEKMLRNGIGRLPVVSRQNPKKVVGYLSRAGVMMARLKRLREEHVIEPGLLDQRSSSRARGDGTRQAPN